MRAIRSLRLLTLTILGLATAAPPAHATIYYIDYAGGSDSNNGTSKATPWKRHPFMQGWTGTYTHVAGDQFIFKGGVTWPNAAFQMTISIGGAPGAGNTDYYGVDKSWFAGASWTRPIFNLQQTALALGSRAVLINNGASYITLDNLELTGLLITGSTVNGQSLIWMDESGAQKSTDIDIKNCNLHGWFRAASVTVDDFGGGIMFVPSTAASTNTIVENSIVQNADGCGDCGGLIRGAGIARNNIVHDAPNGIVSCQEVYGNSVYNIPESFDLTAHENAVYMFGPGDVYNNYIYNVSAAGEVLYLDPSWTADGSGGILTAYNNVIYSISTQINTTFDNERGRGGTISTISRSRNVVSVVLSGAWGCAGCPALNPVVGSQITINGVTGGTTSFNGNFAVCGLPTTGCATPTATSFTYQQTGADESGTISASSAAYVYNEVDFYNNTLECGARDICIQGGGRTWPLSSATVENTHYIGSALPSSVVFCHDNTVRSCPAITSVSDTSNLQMTTGDATSQGYTATNQYAPTSATNSTVGAGLNLTRLGIPVLDSDIKSVARPGSGAWDLGAYQFLGGSRPPPPKNLTIVVK